MLSQRALRCYANRVGEQAYMPLEDVGVGIIMRQCQIETTQANPTHGTVRMTSWEGKEGKEGKEGIEEETKGCVYHLDAVWGQRRCSGHESKHIANPAPNIACGSTAGGKEDRVKTGCNVDLIMSVYIHVILLEPLFPFLPTVTQQLNKFGNLHWIPSLLITCNSLNGWPF